MEIKKQIDKLTEKELHDTLDYIEDKIESIAESKETKEFIKTFTGKIIKTKNEDKADSIIDDFVSLYDFNKICRGQFKTMIYNVIIRAKEYKQQKDREEIYNHYLASKKKRLTRIRLTPNQKKNGK